MLAEYQDGSDAQHPFMEAFSRCTDFMELGAGLAVGSFQGAVIGASMPFNLYHTSRWYAPLFQHMRDESPLCETIYGHAKHIGRAMGYPIGAAASAAFFAQHAVENPDSIAAALFIGNIGTGFGLKVRKNILLDG